MKLDTTNNKLIVDGTLVNLVYDNLKFKGSDGKERKSEEKYYQITLAVKASNNITDADLQSIRDRYYSNVEENFMPKWLKADVSDLFSKGENLLINLKSRYDVKHFVKADDFNDYECLSFEDMLDRFGVVNGSSVTISINCKEGALYPLAIRYDTIKTVSVSDYFA